MNTEEEKTVITTAELEDVISIHLDEVETGLNLSEDEKRLRTRQAWEQHLSLEFAEGERTRIEDPYRSVSLDLLGHGSVMDDIHKIIAEEAYERLLYETQHSTEAVAISRMSQMKNVAELSTGYSSLANAILSMAEQLNITIREHTFNRDLVPITYERHVKLGDKATVNDLRHISALILAKARQSIDMRESQDRQIRDKDREISELKLTLSQTNAALQAAKAVPKSSPIDGLKYVLAGKFLEKKTGKTVTKYAYKGDESIWGLTTILSKATRFSSQDKAVAKLAWLLTKTAEHSIEQVINLKVSLINLIDDELTPENTLMLKARLPK